VLTRDIEDITSREAGLTANRAKGHLGRWPIGQSPIQESLFTPALSPHLSSKRRRRAEKAAMGYGEGPSRVSHKMTNCPFAYLHCCTFAHLGFCPDGL